MNISDKVRIILNALGFTPETLSKRTGMPLKNARRIFKSGGKVKGDEFLEICSLTGINPMMFLNGGDVA